MSSANDGSLIFDHGESVFNPIDITGQTQATLALTTASAYTSAILLEGRYDLWVDADCYILVGYSTASAVTTSNGYLLRTGGTLPDLLIPRGGAFLGGVVASGAATISYMKVG